MTFEVIFDPQHFNECNDINSTIRQVVKDLLNTQKLENRPKDYVFDKSVFDESSTNPFLSLMEMFKDENNV